jgi:diguanylate cyclase (GGDEF)-like protein
LSDSANKAIPRASPSTIEFRAEQLKLLFEQSYFGAFLSIPVALLLVLVLWEVQDHRVLYTWIAGIFLTGAVRLAVFLSYRRSGNKMENAARWERAYFLSAAAYFLCWGLGCLWILPPQSQLHQILVMYFVIGMAGSAVSAFAAYRRIQVGAVSALILPLLPWFLTRGDSLSTGIGLGALAFYLYTLNSAKALSSTLKDKLKLTALLHQAMTNAEHLARVDELTGVKNRRAFYEAGAVEIARGQRSRQFLSVIALDADHFKKINDQHGHSTGDLALQHLATVLTDNLRATDILGRIGGEEFAILLPNTSLSAATEVAEKLSLALRRTPLVVDDTSISLTASFGVACGTESLDKLLKDADTALYLSKERGRDQVSVSSADHEPG